jgi:hypothetical protein
VGRKYASFAERQSASHARAAKRFYQGHPHQGRTYLAITLAPREATRGEGWPPPIPKGKTPTVPRNRRRKGFHRSKYPVRPSRRAGWA